MHQASRMQRMQPPQSGVNGWAQLCARARVCVGRKVDRAETVQGSNLAPEESTPAAHIKLASSISCKSSRSLAARGSARETLLHCA